MQSSRWGRAALLIFFAGVIVVLGMQAAGAAVIGTQAAIELEERAERIAQINSLLARDDVRSMLVARGVSHEDAAARVETMTDEELQILAAELDELPAGGVSVIGVVGIVAIVLVVLELLDVIDLFTRF